MTTDILHQAEVEQWFDKNDGILKLRGALYACDDLPSLLQLLLTYVEFDAPFGAATAALAAQLALRRQTFRDPRDRIELLADRAVYVAAAVFQAAIDEFGDAASPRATDHRTLAQLMIRSILECLGTDGCPDLAVFPGSDVSRDILQGYGVNLRLDDVGLFRALGFHLASEFLARDEFELIWTVLNERWGALIDTLRASLPDGGSRSLDGFVWVRIHCKAEVEHAMAALDAVNRAIRYYHGSASREALMLALRRGAEEFCDVHIRLMSVLLLNTASSSERAGKRSDGKQLTQNAAQPEIASDGAARRG